MEPSPGHWAITRLGEIVTLNYGKGLPRGKRSPQGRVPVYGSNGIVGYHSKPLVKCPSIIIGRKGTIGAVHLSDNPCWPIDTTYFIESAPNHLDFKFLFYLLKELNLKSLDRSTAIPGLNRTDVYKIEVKIPPIKEQKRIAAKLDRLYLELHSCVTILGENDILLKRYQQSILESAFEGKLTSGGTENQDYESLERKLSAKRIVKGNLTIKKTIQLADSDYVLPKYWIWAHLGNIGELNRGKSKHRPRDDGILFGGNYPFIQTGDIRKAKDGTIDTFNETYNDRGLKQSRLWPENTLCITIATNIAETAILGIKACFPDSIVGFIPDPEITEAKFIHYYFKLIRQELEKKASATAQKNINLNILRNLVIPLPSLSEQNKIVEKLDRIFSATSIIQGFVKESLMALDRLNHSISKVAFEGKLVPQDPHDEPAAIHYKE